MCGQRATKRQVGGKTFLSIQATPTPQTPPRPDARRCWERAFPIVHPGQGSTPAGVSTLTSGAQERRILSPHLYGHHGTDCGHFLPLAPVVRGQQTLEAQRQEVTFLHPLTPNPMLWTYKLNFTGMFDATADLAQAREILAQKMRTNPHAFISKVEPAETSVKTFGDLAKAVIGLK